MHRENVTEVRTRTMRAVASKSNRSTEVRVRASLVAHGVSGFRGAYRTAIGKPDLAFPGERIAVFLDGSFWHGCPKIYRRPKTNQEYWDRKVKSNMRRDEEVLQRLTKDGWLVIRFWEHEIKENRQKVVANVMRAVSTRRRILNGNATRHLEYVAEEEIEYDDGNGL